MRKPVILINGGPAFDKTFEGNSSGINKTYVHAVGAAGGAPVLCSGEDSAEDYADVCDGLILTGSFSYCPRLELKDRLERVGQPARVEFDKKLFWAFKEAGKPIFGICLGQRIMNLFLGGTVSINFKYKDGVEHMMTSHLIRTEPGSVLHELFGAEFYVNSRHNNAIEDLAPGFKATAWSPDGIIEAVEHETLPIWATQFHPERMRGDIPEPPMGPDTTPLFRWFVGKCQGNRQKEI